MIRYEIINQTDIEIKETEDIDKVIKSAAKIEKLENIEFNIIFVDDNEIQRINREYRNIDKITDVISFALEDDNDIEYENYRLLGDIYISINQAYRQAKEYGNSNKREICFLTIHGLLHLLGYDHMNEDCEKIMFDKQEEILNAIS